MGEAGGEPGGDFVGPVGRGQGGLVEGVDGFLGAEGGGAAAREGDVGVCVGGLVGDAGDGAELARGEAVVGVGAGGEEVGGAGEGGAEGIAVAIAVAAAGGAVGVADGVLVDAADDGGPVVGRPPGDGFAVGGGDVAARGGGVKDGVVGGLDEADAVEGEEDETDVALGLAEGRNWVPGAVDVGVGDGLDGATESRNISGLCCWGEGRG